MSEFLDEFEEDEFEEEKFEEEIENDPEDTVEDWEILGLESDATQEEINQKWENQM